MGILYYGIPPVISRDRIRICKSFMPCRHLLAIDKIHERIYVQEVMALGIDIKKFLTRFFTKKKEQPEPPKAVPVTRPSPEPPAISKQPVVISQTHSRRAEDMSAEAELARFLDRYLYARFPNADAFDSIERTYRKAQQLSGIDLIFRSKDSRTFCVDEKAQLYYLNKDLPTFAFEIEFLRHGIPTTGWLCDRGLDTDLYLLVWPFAKQDSPKDIKAEDFTKADCLLVSKAAVLHHLASQGLTAERLLQDAKHIRSEGKIGKIPISGVNGIYYYASDPQQYQEAPINIVISKQHLMRIKQRRYIVTPEKVEME